jgi:hypothetical protein
MDDEEASNAHATARGIQKMHMSHTRSAATKEEIAVCAYFIWEHEGKPEGRALDHWLQAELQLAASLWHESLWFQEDEHWRLRADHA